MSLKRQCLLWPLPSKIVRVIKIASYQILSVLIFSTVIGGNSCDVRTCALSRGRCRRLLHRLSSVFLPWSRVPVFMPWSRVPAVFQCSCCTPVFLSWSRVLVFMKLSLATAEADAKGGCPNITGPNSLLWMPSIFWRNFQQRNLRIYCARFLTASFNLMQGCRSIFLCSGILPRFLQLWNV